MDASCAIVVFNVDRLLIVQFCLCPPYSRDCLCARLISDHPVSLGTISQRSSRRHIAHKSLALKWLIKNQLKMIKIGREYRRGTRRGPGTDVSMHMSHAYQTHYCRTQTLPAKPNGCHNWAMFRRGNNFLAKGGWKRGNEFMQIYRSAHRPAGCSRQYGKNRYVWGSQRKASLKVVFIFLPFNNRHLILTNYIHLL